MNIEERLKELGIEIPSAISPAGNYAPAVCTGDLLFTAGQTPKADGKLRYIGKLGADVSDEDGKEAARLCIINCLAIVKQTAGSLDCIDQIVKLTGYVNSAPNYYNQIKLLDAATDLLRDIFQDSRGTPARSAVGVAVLPNNAACEIELIVRLKPHI